MSFVDEADNFTGGWLISKGFVLYKDIFSHHMPLPYYHVNLLIKFGMDDVIGLRIGMSLTILFFWVLIIVIFKDKIDYKILSLLIFLSAIAHPLFMGHMFLADSFFAYSTLIIFLYFFSQPQLNFKLIDQIVISLMIFISIMSTLISIYSIIVLVLYYILTKLTQFLRVEKTNIKNQLSSEIKFVFMILAPFILSLILFCLTDSLQQFYNEAYLFNKLYYVQFTGPLTEVRFFEPIKAYSEHIFFYISNVDWLINKKSFIWVVPPWNNTLLFFEGFLVISNLIILVIFWKKRNLYFSILYFSFLAFLRIRGGEFHGSGWIHGVPYYLLSFFSIGFVLTEAYEFLIYKYKLLLNSRRPTTEVKLYIILIVVLYGFLAIIFVGVLSYAYVSNGSGTGEHNNYVSTYDNIIQTITQPNDTIWVAPLEPSLFITNNRLPASRYTFYLPWQSVSDEINEELIEDLKVKKPPLIIFARDAVIWDRYVLKDYGEVIDDYIQTNYYQVDSDDPVYKNVYLINSKRTQLLKTLHNDGLYQPIDAKQLDTGAHIGEITAGSKIVQTFTPSKPGVHRIDLMLATFARKNHGKIIFHLKENLTGDDVYYKTEDISKIKDNSWYTIYFPQFNDSMIGERIYLVIEAPESKPGDAITIYSSKNDTYKMGELYINGQPTGKDLTFRTCWNPYSNNT